MPIVVHISADFPDAAANGKTQAIARLVEATANQFTHRVYSLNRTGGLSAFLRPGQANEIADDGSVASWRYLGPPKGIMLKRAMRHIAAEVIRDLSDRSIAPDLIHAHKLSIEGLAAREIARKLGIPFAISLQGNTDQKIIGIRRDLHHEYRACWNEAATIFPFTPWIEQWCESILGKRSGRIVMLPCMPAIDSTLSPVGGACRIISAFNLDDWRNKNIATLAKAVSLVSVTHPAVELHLAGAGRDGSRQAVKAILAKAGIADRTRLIGRLASAELQNAMNAAAVFALPSLRETFGMVFVESLLGGTPVIYPRGAAIDGYFPDRAWARPVDARNVEAVAAELRAALDDRVSRKQALREAQDRGEFKSFTCEGIAATYTAALLASLPR